MSRSYDDENLLRFKEEESHGGICPRCRAPYNDWWVVCGHRYCFLCFAGVQPETVRLMTDRPRSRIWHALIPLLVGVTLAAMCFQ